MARSTKKITDQLAAGKSIRTAAHECNISERTARRRAKEPAFKRQVNELRDEIVDRIIGRLADAGSEAVDRLLEIGRESKSDTAAVAAYRTLLLMLPKLRAGEELFERVERLEQLLQKIRTHETTNQQPGT